MGIETAIFKGKKKGEFLITSGFEDEQSSSIELFWRVKNFTFLDNCGCINGGIWAQSCHDHFPFLSHSKSEVIENNNSNGLAGYLMDPIFPSTSFQCSDSHWVF